MAERYRKKPVVIEAMQLVGPAAEWHAVYRWVESNTLGSFDVNRLWLDPEKFVWPESGVSIDARDGRIVIATLEGGHWADPGDWVIRGVAGEFYPCKPDIFEQTYNKAEEDLSQVSDGSHTFAELYHYRMLYNALAANCMHTLGNRVYKSWNHSDGKPCFDGGWFIVVMELPQGQVTNHYKEEWWDLFNIPSVERPSAYDGHTPQVAAARLLQYIEEEQI